MKPVYVILLMGAAAIAGGLVVRYSEHPARPVQSNTETPKVIAPPVPPAGHAFPTPAPPEKPSALSLPVHIGKPDAPTPPPTPTQEPRPPLIARSRVPADPPAVFPLGHTVAPQLAPPLEAVPQPSPAPPPSPDPKPEPKAAAPNPPPPQPNHVTLRPGLLIPIRLSQPLSADRNVQGDVWTGTLDQPLTVDGFVIAEKGARVRGEVLDAKRPHLFGAGELTIELKEVATSDGQKVHLTTTPWHKEGPSLAAATSISFRVDQTLEITEHR